MEPRDALAGWKNIRPPLPGLFPHYHWQEWIVALSGFGLLLLLYRYSWRFRRTVTAVVTADRAWIKVSGSILLAVICVILIAIANAGHGEPFAWAEGISLWPTQLIRLLALMLCVCFIYRVLWPSEKVQEEIRGEFFPGSLNAAGSQAIDKYHGTLFQWFNKYPEPGLSIDVAEIEVAKLWGEYRALETRRARIRRLWFPVLCYVGACAGLINAFGGLPNTPYRGEASLYVNGVLLFFLTSAFTVLLFSVVDSIRLCSTFILNLTKGRSDYPLETRTKFGRSFHFDSPKSGDSDWPKSGDSDWPKSGDSNSPKSGDSNSPKSGDSLCDWIDMRLIAQLTERIGEQVYYPFIVLALMLVARSPLFDYWHTPIGLMLVFVLGFAIAITCAVVLQRAAEHARDVALERMTRYLAQAKGEQPPNNALVAQLGMLLDEVKNLHRGAFVPFLQQFLVRAVMVPVGSFGGLQLVEYFLLAWYR